VLWHCALAPQLLLPFEHSSLSEQLKPSPEKPLLQAHEYPSAKSVHEALTSQSSVPRAHSLTRAGVVGAGCVVFGGAAVVRRLPLFFFFLLPPPLAALLACDRAIS